MYELVALELWIVMFLLVWQTVKTTDVLKKEAVNKSWRDIILPKKGFFEMQFVLLVKVVRA